MEDTQKYTLYKSGRYLTYSKYTDDNISEIDNLKNISVDETQINITQENNSQYIPFRVSRYWDGIDLLPMTIKIHYENSKGDSGIVDAVNVSYNDNFIKFGWLVDENATAVSGAVKFEITAIGKNEKGQNYKWRTKPNGQLNVLEGLSYDGIIEPTASWYQSFETSMNNLVSQADEYYRNTTTVYNDLVTYTEAAKTTIFNVETANAVQYIANVGLTIYAVDNSNVISNLVNKTNTDNISYINLCHQSKYIGNAVSNGVSIDVYGDDSYITTLCSEGGNINYINLGGMS